MTSACFQFKTTHGIEEGTFFVCSPLLYMFFTSFAHIHLGVEHRPASLTGSEFLQRYPRLGGLYMKNLGLLSCSKHCWWAMCLASSTVVCRLAFQHVLLCCCLLLTYLFLPCLQLLLYADDAGEFDHSKFSILWQTTDDFHEIMVSGMRGLARLTFLISFGNTLVHIISLCFPVVELCLLVWLLATKCGCTV